MKRAAIAVLMIALCMCLTPMVSLADDDSNARVALSAEESVFRIGSLQRIDSLNPNVGLMDVSQVFYGLVYDSLFSVGDDLETVGNLATDWRIVPEDDPELMASGEMLGSVWEYNITANANWCDGEPLTVDDVVWTINLNADNYNEMWAYQPYTYYMDYAEAVDEDTLRVHFYDRSTGLPMPAAYGDSLYIPILPKHMLETYSPGVIGFVWAGVFANTTYPLVGTGPFVATEHLWDEYIEGDNITLVKNPNHHWVVDKGEEVQFDKIIISFYDDPTAMSLALRQGEIDVGQFPPQIYLGIEEDVTDGLLEDVECFDGLKCTGYWTEVLFNMNEGGPNKIRLDPAVRQAMAMATDKEFIADTFYAGLAEPGSTLISPAIEAWHYELAPEEIYEFNLDAAAQMLEDAGYTYTEYSLDVRVATADSLAVQEGWALEGEPLTFDMLTRIEAPEEGDIAVHLQTVLAEIGIDLHIRAVDEVTMAVEIYSYEYDTAIWYWCADPDPNCMLYCQSSVAIGGWSDNAYSSAAYDENYNASVMALDYEDRKAYVDECQRIHYGDVPYIILAYTNQTYAWRTDTFDGWGDWASNPGRSLDAYWGANPLIFDLVPVGSVTNAAPTNVALEPPDDGMYAGYPVELTASADDADLDDLLFEVEFGDGTSEEQESVGTTTSHEVTFTHTYASPGEYEVNVTVDDQTGLLGHIVAYGPVMFTVLGDDIPPVTTAALDGDLGDNGWYVSAVTVTFSAADAQSEVDETSYCVDGGTWTMYSAAFEVTGDGTHAVEFYSADVLGNEGDVQDVGFKVDTQTPTVVPSVVEEDGQTHFRYECADETSGLAFSEYSLDGASFVSMGNSSSVSIPVVAEGEHTIVVRIHDNAGNSLTSTTTFTVAPEPDESSPLALYIGLAVVAAAVAAVAAVLLIKRKR